MTQLKNGFTERQIAAAITHRRMELTILPTEKCNFRCTYCYETFENGRMAPHVVEGVCNLISNRAAELEELCLSWFGGEPLLALPVVREILRHAKAEADQKGFRLYGGFTTNAYLLDRSLLEELVGYGQDFFQITLDGWGEQHDKTRRRADGAGTFERIWSNLLSFRESALDFEVQLRVHVSHENGESVRALCREIREAFGKDGRFRVDLQDIRDMGGSGSENVVPLTSAQFEREKRALLEILYPESAAQVEAVMSASVKVGESAARRRSEERSEPEPYICYAAKPNQFLIRSTGRIGKCTVMLDDPRNDVGFLRPDGTLHLDDERLMPWFEGLVTLDVNAVGCPIHHAETLRAKGRELRDAKRIELALATA